jgi:hypothetical protein
VLFEDPDIEQSQYLNANAQPRRVERRAPNL